MLGQPVYFLTPDVVGVHLSGSLREGATATDAALTVTELLRKAKVVGKFVEFFGPGAAALPVVDRATMRTWRLSTAQRWVFFRLMANAFSFCAPPGEASLMPALRELLSGAGIVGCTAARAGDYTRELDLDLGVSCRAWRVPNGRRTASSCPG